MTRHDTITVNGQTYDTVTGLPIAATTSSRTKAPKQPATPSVATAKPNAQTLHAAAQRSKTLRRTAQPKKPAAVKPASIAEPLAKRRPARRLLDVARHPEAKKFAPAPTKGTAKSDDIAPRQHPHVAKTRKVLATKKQTAAPRASHPPAKAIKEAEIARVLREATPNKKQPKKAKSMSRKMRIGIIVAASIVVLGALVWVSLPTLSLKFASAQSGVNARLPHFTPDSYAITLPVSAEANRVAMTFTSKQANTSYTLTQENSSWDSQAVRAMVETASNGQFLTTQDRGLTIYTYNGNAAWVNKGILYKLSGNSLLSGDTIIRIASSL